MTGATNILHTSDHEVSGDNRDNRGSAATTLKGNSKDSKPVMSFGFSFVSGNDSNVVITTKQDPQTADEGRFKVLFDVYYV